MLNFTKSELKTNLIATGEYGDNEYLDKYIDLLFDNQDQVYIKYQTQKHHFIPVANYGNTSSNTLRSHAEKLADADIKNFKIDLLYKYHVLAHYYLSRCAITPRSVSINCKALRNVLRNTYYQKLANYIEERDLLLKLKGIQEAYSIGTKAYEASLTDEQKEKRSKLHSIIQLRVAKTFTEEELQAISLKRKAAWEAHSEARKENYSNQKRAEVKERWANRSPEYKEQIRQKIIATKKARSAELKKQDIEKQRQSFFNHTEEELLQRKLKKQKAYEQMSLKSKQLRSKRISDKLKSQSEERSKKFKQIWAEKSLEEKSLISQKIWETRRKNKALKNKTS